MSDAGVWVKLEDAGSSGELPGLGGWATIKEVSGNPTRYEYPAGNPEWVAFEWTNTSTTGNVKIAEEGLMEVLVVGGGAGTSGDGSIRGSGGGVIKGVEMMSVDSTVAVGAGGDNSGSSTSGMGKYSQLGEIRVGGGTRIDSPNGYKRGSSGGYYAGAGSAGNGQGRTTGGVGTISNIRTGVDELYASGGGDYRPPADDRPGDGADGDNQAGTGYGVAGENGCVIIRVPVEYDDTKGQGSTPASVVAAVDQAKETIKRNRRNR